MSRLFLFKNFLFIFAAITCTQNTRPLIFAVSIRAMTYDEFGFEEDAGGTESPPEPHVPIREQFPPAGSVYLGGSSDGWEYRTVFAGAKLAYTYEMVKQFLREEGYGDVPLPETAEELKLFKRPRGHQLQLFGEQGYRHNPVKILFPGGQGRRNTLILCVYNEQAPHHLLRFHGVLREKPEVQTPDI